MNWIRLTRPYGTHVWVNLSRFDTIVIGEDEDGVAVTQLIATFSDVEEDNFCVEVKESPEEILGK